MKWRENIPNTSIQGGKAFFPDDILGDGQWICADVFSQSFLFTVDLNPGLHDIEWLDAASCHDTGESSEEVGLHWGDGPHEGSPEEMGFVTHRVLC